MAPMDEHEHQDDGHERRNKRSLVLLAAKVSTPDGVIEARLRNLSQKGALLEGDRIPPVGTDLIFERGETKVRGRVAWARDGRFGIEFLTPIEDIEFRHGQRRKRIDDRGVANDHRVEPSASA